MYYSIASDPEACVAKIDLRSSLLMKVLSEVGRTLGKQGIPFPQMVF